MCCTTSLGRQTCEEHCIWALPSLRVEERETEEGSKPPTRLQSFSFKCRESRQQVPHNQPLSGEHRSESRCPGLQSWTACPDLLSTGPDKNDQPRSLQAWCCTEKKIKQMLARQSPASCCRAGAELTWAPVLWTTCSRQSSYNTIACESVFCLKKKKLFSADTFSPGFRATINTYPCCSTRPT